MTKYLISFPASAMDIPDEDMAAIGVASHAVIREAKDAGVYVFGGPSADFDEGSVFRGEDGRTASHGFDGGESELLDDRPRWRLRLRRWQLALERNGGQTHRGGEGRKPSHGSMLLNFQLLLSR